MVKSIRQKRVGKNGIGIDKFGIGIDQMELSGMGIDKVDWPHVCCAS